MESFMKEFKDLAIQLDEIKAATDNFNQNMVIGTGGFGNVYKGEVSHSRGRSIVAFKRLDSKFGQGEPEFWKEVIMLSRYTHKNLISLLGFCNEGTEKILVYEHASRGSLDRHLSATDLTWTQRISICLDAARGLSYLHGDKGSQQRLLHRDIKSSNILLDDNWNAKVSDLGLSKIGPANQQYTVLVTNIAGTPGYCDPLYMETYYLTKESDVYSFGVVLLEVLFGRLCCKCSNGQIITLVPTWKKNYAQKKLDEIIFQDLKKQMGPSSSETFSNIAFQCLQRSREERPPMCVVVEKLEIALKFQKRHDLNLPEEHEEIVNAVVTPLNNFSVQEQKLLPHQSHKEQNLLVPEELGAFLNQDSMVFEYFASVKRTGGESLMTPGDLMRAIVPVFPPSESELNIVREGFLRWERDTGESRCVPSKLLMLFDVNSDGLISFQEYVFCVTILSIPESSFSVTFKMFDINNDGDIDREEFKKVMTLMRGHNSQGAFQNDGLRTGLAVGGNVENGGLVEYFFGKDGNHRLQHEKFVQFLQDLHREMTWLEFSHYDFKLRGSVAAKDFVLSMVASGDTRHMRRLLDRADELDNETHLKDMRITGSEFESFAKLRKKLHPFSLALFSYGEVNGFLTKMDFQRAATQVCSISLSDNVIELIFHLFDANRDGYLCSDEFLPVMRRRESQIAQFNGLSI